MTRRCTIRDFDIILLEALILVVLVGIMVDLFRRPYRVKKVVFLIEQLQVAILSQSYFILLSLYTKIALYLMRLVMCQRTFTALFFELLLFHLLGVKVQLEVHMAEVVVPIVVVTGLLS